MTAAAQSKVKVAALKVASRFGTREATQHNVKTILELIRNAAEAGAKIVVMPETAINGYASQDLSTTWYVKGYPRDKTPDGKYFGQKDPTHLAFEVGDSGPLHKDLAPFAEQSTKLGVYIVATFLEKAKQTNEKLKKHYGPYVFYSSSILFKPGEGKVGHYRKMNPWLAVDKAFMTAGDRIVTYDSEYGRISFCVCFDVMALLPLIKKHNVWAHFHSFAWVDEKDGRPLSAVRHNEEQEEWDGNWFRAGLPGKLFMNAGGFYFVAANWSTEKIENWTGHGYESIYSPEGIILAQDTETTGNGFVIAELDPPEYNPPPPFPLYE